MNVFYYQPTAILRREQVNKDFESFFQKVEDLMKKRTRCDVFLADIEKSSFGTIDLIPDMVLDGVLKEYPWEKQFILRYKKTTYTSQIAFQCSKYILDISLKMIDDTQAYYYINIVDPHKHTLLIEAKKPVIFISEQQISDLFGIILEALGWEPYKKALLETL